MTPKVPTSDRGTATLGITVPESVRRKTKMTSTTSTTVTISSNWTSFTEARIVLVRSVRIEIDTDVGSVFFRSGSSALTRSTTSIMFVPGCRWIFTMMAGTVFIHAACLTFSAPSITVATSDS